MPTPVLLLRTPTATSESTPDRYHAALRSSPGSHAPRSLPVLETTLVVSDLRARIGWPPERALRGIIVTSARAAEAWRVAIEGLREFNLIYAWSSIPFYTVGAATATILASIAPTLPPECAPLCPVDIRGAHTGSADALARFIVEDIKASRGEGGRRGERDHDHDDEHESPTLLYLTGDKNRETLPAIIGAAGVALEEEQVYATTGIAQDALGGSLQEIFDAVAREDGTEPWWIVFFAPSAAAHALPVLERHFVFPRIGENAGSEDAGGADSGNGGGGKRATRVAAIGPTTAGFLRDERGLRVDAVPAKPSAEALAASLVAAERAQEVHQ